ncbi:hypothetical protein AM10699_41470 [Acaryochloris marina MBIC10699]|nr:hypothetical protein AM10699_41470 [Acaryochloris marina MBIC10699]
MLRSHLARSMGDVPLKIDSEKDFMKFFSTAPVIALVFFTLTAGFLVELNRFFPDILFFPY